MDTHADRPRRHVRRIAPRGLCLAVALVAATGTPFADERATASRGASVAPPDTPSGPTAPDAARSLAAGWTLGRDGVDRVLLDGTGTAIRFAPRRRLERGRWRWMAHDGALLEGGAGRYRLTTADGRTVELDGSNPRGVARSGGNAGRAAFKIVHCPAEERCDATDSPVPPAFERGPTIPGASTLDVRPAHCGSHFANPVPTARGTAIERGLAGLGPHAGQRPASRSFPAVDFVAAGELVVVRSRDLAAPAYADARPNALYERLMRDGLRVHAQLIVPLASAGAVAVTPERGDAGVSRVEAVPGRTVVLELVVRHGIAGPVQIEQIRRARAELARRHGIELRVVEIP